MIFNKQLEIKASCSDLIKAIKIIDDFLNTDPYLKLSIHRQLSQDKRTFSEYIFVETEKDKLHIYITDGFRALVYSISCYSTGNNSRFSIKRSDALKIINYSGTSEIILILNKNKFTIKENDIEIFSCDAYGGTPRSVFCLSRGEIVAIVKIDGLDLQRQSSLFSRNETFKLIVNPVNNEIVIERSKTGVKGVLKAEIGGKNITRYVNPIFLFSFALFLKNEKKMDIIFRDPYLIELKEKNNNELLYMLMPIKKD